jgi:sulfocyanin SoxE-like protein
VKLSAVALLVTAAASAAAQGRPAAAQAIDPGWLAVDASTHTAEFQLVAGLTGLNGALNFNGFRDGGLTLTVPKDWTVLLHFRNHDGMLPHSAEVIADVRPIPAQPPDPAFPRAFTLKLAEGLPPEGTDDVRFTADREGAYLIFCGVPGHAAAGMWIRLRIAAAARTATLAVSP